MMHARKQMTRRVFAAATAALLAATCLAGCGGQKEEAPAADLELSEVVIGTMPTEDTLPFYVAAENGAFEAAGVPARIEFFQSAQELSVAVTSGSVQMAMTDPMVAASLTASGTPVTCVWVTLGTDASQGRFGVQVPADSPYTQLSDLAGVPVGVGSNTVPEYVFDTLMARAGVPEDQIVGEEVKKLPVRYQMMESGQIAAAALPGSMLALGEASGCVTLADDSTGENISASVMIANSEWAATPEGAASIELLAGVWDDCAEQINADPDAYRGTLIANANLSDLVAETYPIATYPLVQIPDTSLVEPVLDWMSKKGYLTVPVTYDAATGALTA